MDLDQPPALQGRHIYLRPVMPSDYGLLQAMETVGPHASRWRFRGETPSPERWVQTLWAGVWAQYLVVRRADDEPIGFVYGYRASQLDRHCHFAALSFATSTGPLMTLGVAFFLNHLFTAGAFRVAYAEVPEYNLKQFASAIDRYCRIEGQLRDYVFWNGRHWDMYTLAFRPDQRGENGLLHYERGAPAAATDEPEPVGSTGFPRRVVFRQKAGR